MLVYIGVIYFSPFFLSNAVLPPFFYMFTIVCISLVLSSMSIQIVFHLRSRVSMYLQDVVVLQTMQRFTKVRKNNIYTSCRSMRKKKEELKYLVCEPITIEYELQSLTILFSVRKVEKLQS